MKIKFISRIVALAMLASSFYLLGSARGAAQSYYTNAAAAPSSAPSNTTRTTRTRCSPA